MLCDEVAVNISSFCFTQKSYRLLFLSHCKSEYLTVFRLELFGPLPYMADTFTKLNELSLSHQDQTIIVFQAYDKFQTFQKKLVCGQSIKKCKFSVLQTFNSSVSENDLSLSRFVFLYYLISLFSVTRLNVTCQKVTVNSFGFKTHQMCIRDRSLYSLYSSSLWHILHISLTWIGPYILLK